MVPILINNAVMKRLGTRAMIALLSQAATLDRQGIVLHERMPYGVLSKKVAKMIETISTNSTNLK